MMRIVLNSVILIIAAVFLFGCMPEDKAVQPYDRGDAEVASVELGENYSNQIYYSLENNCIVKQNKTTDWDIAFDCKEDSFDITLNNAKMMRVYCLGNRTFESVTSAEIKAVSNDSWVYDNPTGNSDSTAIGKWWTEGSSSQIVSANNVYAIDRGKNDLGRSLGFVLLKINNFQDNSYNFEFYDLTTKTANTAKLTKDDRYNYIQFSFDNGGKILNLEPEKDKWDLLFTKYAELLQEDATTFLWYSVVGTLINNRYCKAAKAGDSVFTNITYAGINANELTSIRNIIGYDWKKYNMDDNVYTVDDKKVYIIRTCNGFFFKLHFVDFYNQGGVKGTPKFEFKKL